ncbi:putative fatty acyl-CoA reductase CG5065 isoform X2 [Photinus pyralis]|uniref:putative fatty acyl-CoA reductase CG5065 isoform X2 n=1 Tax=Photinus pyralis TaxID=7054 RepID=UPI0012671850|nr:putative fatty acyl-CoA reductase CG5065 isoform X2 [Photinus pyralis]
MATQIQSFYADSTILITGATGLVGNYLIEKLLRSCPKVKKVYLLIRGKGTKNGADRLVDLLTNPKSDPQLLLKLEVLKGDLQLEKLGLDEDDLGKVVSEVNCIFHVAATVKFTDKLRNAVLINVKGVDSLIGICRLMQNLKSVVYVSTAFSQVANMNETLSPSFVDSDQLIEMVDHTDDSGLRKITPQILGEWPNTYSFSKNVAEDILRRKGRNLPIAIVRPSLVLPPCSEPNGDWSNSPDWFFAYCSSVSLGLWHTTKCSSKDVVDMVPVDYVVNHLRPDG